MRPPDLDALAMSNEQVAALGAKAREARVQALIAESHAILDYAIWRYVVDDDKDLRGICTLFSGGNDSTALAHLFKGRSTHAIHANTTIGVEATRQFVRDTCVDWGLPLLEFSPDERDNYRTMVLERGFPGPGMHYKTYQRLKERGLRKARRVLVTSGRTQRVIFLAGRRRTESTRRANVPAFERVDSIVWVSPMVNWTKLDINTYRILTGDVPTNEVTSLLHMSGECLCGAFAHVGELTEIAMWYPAVAEEIHELERLIADRTDIPEQRKTWGWGRGQQKPSKSGPLCSSCDARFLSA